MYDDFTVMIVTMRPLAGFDMTQQPVKLKIFGNDQATDEEEDYYESFFNLDLPNGLVFWNEKDQEYREPLVRSLSCKAE